MHDWSPQQSRALTAVGAWLRTPSAPQIFYLAGYAGTGKTTLAQHLVSEVEGTVLFMAYTGKAASVLRARGCANASTIHQILYQHTPASRLKLREMEERLATMRPDDPRRRDLRRAILNERQRLSQPRWSLNPESPIKYAEVLVLDECSMVNGDIARDLMSFQKKILVLGDPAQLPPVAGHGYFTSREPDICLTEIHRQARDNPIIRWATRVREGDALPYGQEGVIRKVRKSSVEVEEILELVRADGQILCGTNLSRRKLNHLIRDRLGIKSLLPAIGDKLVCLKNNHELGLLNGVQARAVAPAIVDKDDEHGALKLSVAMDGFTHESLDVAPYPFREEDFDSAYWSKEYGLLMSEARHLEHFDYGYALTVHKAQGSQWDQVLVWDDGFAKRSPGDRRKWMYTAITRASHSLTIAS